jgi:hypothetical protein
MPVAIKVMLNAWQQLLDFTEDAQLCSRCRAELSALLARPACSVCGMTKQCQRNICSKYVVCYLQDMLVKQIEGHTICALGDAGRLAGHLYTAAGCTQGGGA